MRALSEKRLSDYMAEQIADEILSGRIEGGSQLKQEELAEVFWRIPDSDQRSVSGAGESGSDRAAGNKKNLHS